MKGMRHPKQIADEMESLVDSGDSEAAHARADDLLVELVEQLAPTRDQAPFVFFEVKRAVELWRKGSKHWWYA